MLAVAAVIAEPASSQPCEGPLFPGAVYPAGSYPQSVSLGDLDGDGDLDMAVANWGSDDMSVLLNNGDGTFGLQTSYAVGDMPQSV
ncbi:MAG: VCBS repeat-containing protein [Phycisphaerales bacterium]|nr:VCBS repeat-containing protein [Phycisphaerales bacterium]